MFAAVVAVAFSLSADAQGVKRLVIIKVDGLPNYYVDALVRERDPATGRSKLPWIEDAFYKNGSRMVNFYTRGMSLSGPAWGQLDTGQHMQIKGNVEFDRYTQHAYDYLNIFPFYLDYGRYKTVDMPAVEVLDQLGVPLFSDQFPFGTKYLSQQLYQRGNDWAPFASGFVNMLPKTTTDAIDEWTLGFDLRNMLPEQQVRDITGKLIKRSEIDYLDFYTVAFDHASHHFNDPAIRYSTLKEIDRFIGHIWVAIQRSPRADETALVLVSDHGFNSAPGTYSQGFNIVKLLGRAEGGAHHVITKRRLMLDYSIRGLYPFTPLVRTSSSESLYLKGQSDKYATALVDFDGNERSSIHLRENDLNILHILLRELQGDRLNAETREAAADEIFAIVDKHRDRWSRTADEMYEELDALQRWITDKQKLLPKLMTKAPRGAGLGRVAENNRRLIKLVDLAVRDEKDYRAQVDTLKRLSSLTRSNFDAKRARIEDYIAPGSMGDVNRVYDLQNYVVGPSPQGLVLNEEGRLDLERSFTRIDYFDLLQRQTVRNNVQEKVGNRPIDFIAAKVHLGAIRMSFPGSLQPNDDAVWMYASPDKQGLILSRTDENGKSFRYLPVANLRQTPDGKLVFDRREWSAGFPLKLFEDPALAVPDLDRAAWLDQWHTEVEWLTAIHKTRYSNGLIGLNEQLDDHPVDGDTIRMSEDEKLIRRFRERQRRLTEADLLVLANDHWNFDVRGFNPGGNHGSFLRASTNATFMIAGGDKTGIPRSLAVETPYDSMSFVPTLMRLMGKIDEDNRPVPELIEKGYRQFPGRVVREIVTR